MTSYTIMLGYNSSKNTSECAEELRKCVAHLRANFTQIAEEAKRFDGFELDELNEFAMAYAPVNNDLTIQIVDGEYDDFRIFQMASGGEVDRSIKESLRRAFCRLVLNAMHKKQIEVNIIVS